MGEGGCDYNERVELNRQPQRKKDNKKSSERDRNSSYGKENIQWGEKVALNRRRFGVEDRAPAS